MRRSRLKRLKLKQFFTQSFAREEYYSREMKDDSIVDERNVFIPAQTVSMMGVHSLSVT